MSIKRAILSAVTIWILGVGVYTASYFIEIISDPELQANLVLATFLLPIAVLGAHIYYKNGLKTNGLRLGVAMFFIAMILDALFTVPLLIIPYGGDHFTFFTAPEFWLIAVEYIGTITLYWRIKIRER